MAEREPFPTLIVNEVWARCGGCCECEDGRTAMTARADSVGIMPMQGGPNIGGWEAVARDPEGPLTAENCMIVCAPCFAKMRQAGKI